MITIDSISAKGFKSFAKKIEVPFGKNYNIFIGPNGSGKSNFVDLITFVLGKSSAKQLRAEKSSNLIYNGGKQGSPAKEAEASIVFDNSDNELSVKEKKVQLTRIVRHSGNSIYKINGNKVTRQQVLEMLNKARINADGHNIVLQGDIVHFMEMRPEERKGIIEEVSGISVYEEKKQKALNELEKVNAKLSEANIILTERNTYLRELKSERDQAVRYKELEHVIKRSKATLINKQIREKQDVHAEIESKIQEENKKKEALESRIKELKDIITNHKEEIKTINENLDKKGRKEQTDLSKEIEVLKETLIKQSTRLDVVKSELVKIEQRKKQFSSDITDIDKRINALDNEIKQVQLQETQLQKEEVSISQAIQDFRKKHNLLAADEIEGSIEKKQNMIAQVQEKRQDLLREYDKNKYQLEDVESKLASQKQEDSGKNIKNLKQEFKDLSQELTKRLNDDAAYANQLGKARRDLVVNNEQLAKLRMLNITSTERTAADLSIKKILESGISGIYNKISEIGEVKKQYSLALEIAAGGRINSVVVEDDKTASRCIQYLKDKRLGVVAFLPLNKIKSSIPSNISSGKGIHGRAIDLIKCEPRFKSVFSYVFGPTIIVDDVETARRIGIGTTRMVTLEGDLMETSGAMIGGHRTKRKGLGFKEQGIKEEITKLEAEIERLSNAVSVIENSKTSNEENIYKLREKKALLEVEIMKMEKASGGVDYSAMQQRQKDLTQLIKKSEIEVKNMNQDLASYSKELEILKQKRQQSKQANYKELTDLEQKKEKLRESLLNMQNTIKNNKAQKETILLPEKEKMKKILANNDKELGEFRQESATLTAGLAENKNNLKEREAKEREFYKEFRNQFDRRSKLNESIQKQETNLVREEERVRSVESRINNINIDRARIVAEMEGLKKEFEPFADVQLRKVSSLAELKQEMQSHEKEIAKLGNINLRALEVYERLEEEYAKLKEKEETLKSEKNDVLAMMNEIESKKKDLFMKTFRHINKRFKEIFNDLSTKGEASLELQNQENPLEGGIDIKVKIIGSKFLDIKSLSGGEKTMAALAMIFSIQEYQPASFYVLDEVDAALDKTNSSLLSKLIQKYSKGAQYIVISHNDTVISEADQIYGVSMQQGISKVVSLKI